MYPVVLTCRHHAFSVDVLPGSITSRIAQFDSLADAVAFAEGFNRGHAFRPFHISRVTAEDGSFHALDLAAIEAAHNLAGIWWHPLELAA